MTYSTSFSVPILLIIYNRPSNTEKVFQEIRKLQPEKFFISADGPRTVRNGDKELCEKVRQIFDIIDWPCEVHKRFSDENIGCDHHIESAVSWFFEQNEYGIILEDDCIPNKSFFLFCQMLLIKYENNNHVMHINGSNFQFGKQRGEGSYYFSRYSHSWGWATWKRAWALYDTNMQSFPTLESKSATWIKLSTLSQQTFWLNFFRKLYKRKYKFWDSKWTFAIWSADAICVTPNVNLIANIGYGSGSTHTFLKDKLNQKSEEMESIEHPLSINVDEQADEETFNVY